MEPYVLMNLIIGFVAVSQKYISHRCDDPHISRLANHTYMCSSRMHVGVSHTKHEHTPSHTIGTNISPSYLTYFYQARYRYFRQDTVISTQKYFTHETHLRLNKYITRVGLTSQHMRHMTVHTFTFSQQMRSRRTILLLTSICDLKENVICHFFLMEPPRKSNAMLIFLCDIRQRPQPLIRACMKKQLLKTSGSHAIHVISLCM